MKIILTILVICLLAIPLWACNTSDPGPSAAPSPSTESGSWGGGSPEWPYYVSQDKFDFFDSNKKKCYGLFGLWEICVIWND